MNERRASEKSHEYVDKMSHSFTGVQLLDNETKEHVREVFLAGYKQGWVDGQAAAGRKESDGLPT